LAAGGAIRVVAGVLRDARDRVLLAQRPTGRHLAGGWEFPGGKLDDGESRMAGLARELEEEIGIRLRAARPLIRLLHEYPDRRIELDVWRVTHYEGRPVGRERQALRWCERTALNAADLLAADRPVVTALKLPECLREPATALYLIARAPRDVSASGQRDVVTRDVSASGDTRLQGWWCEEVAPWSCATRAALRGVDADFLAVAPGFDARRLAALCAAANVPVYVHGEDVEAAAALGASGVHALERLARDSLPY